MAIPNVVINYWAVLVSAIVAYFIGAFWYSPALFGNAWMKSGGMSQKDINKAKKKGMGKLYFIGFIGTLVMAFVLAHFVQYVGAESFNDAMMLAFWIWLGFFVPVMIGSVLWENKSVKFYLINVVYQLVSLEVMAVILAVWN